MREHRFIKELNQEGMNNRARRHKDREPYTASGNPKDPKQLVQFSPPAETTTCGRSDRRNKDKSCVCAESAQQLSSEPAQRPSALAAPRPQAATGLPEKRGRG